jgi:O-antigen/teichoic acid export membrane protein
MVVSAPELTVLLFGETWLPLVRILRLLMIYLLLKPIVEHANVAFISLGKASITTKLLLVQAAILVILVPLFTFFYGTDGAALGVDIMVLVGFVLSYRRLSEFISFNYKSVFLPPLIGLVLSILVLYALLSIVRVENLFASIAIKSIVLSSVYISSLLLLERERILRMLKYSASLLFRRDVQ